MNEYLAKIVVFNAARSRHLLGDLIPILKNHCDNDECAEVSQAISRLIYDIGDEVIDKIFAEHPQLKLESDKLSEIFGRSYY
jgi:hypothetical protein